MIVLAIDTALAACSAAVVDRTSGAGMAGERAFARSEPMLRGHAEALMPLLDDLLAEAGMRLSEIDRFAVTIGPGTFTGVRVGVAAARGFAVATGRPAVGVGTLPALAETARLQGVEDGPFLVAMDARRGEIYAQSFDAAARPLNDPAVAPISTILGTLPRVVSGVFGTAADGCAQAAGPLRPLAVLGNASAPDPVAVARLAAAPPPNAPAVPLYLRPPDAKPQNAAAIARR